VVGNFDFFDGAEEWVPPSDIESFRRQFKEWYEQTYIESEWVDYNYFLRVSYQDFEPWAQRISNRWWEETVSLDNTYTLLYRGFQDLNNVTLSVLNDNGNFIEIPIH
jgi:hypothetical protein